jgi:hypothetical protein
MAIASRAQTACTKRHDHFTKLTCDWLTMMRCRRASRAFSRAVALGSGERDEKAEDDTQRRQHTGGDGLE